MGFYIDPSDRSKEDFLAENGTLIHENEAKTVLANGSNIPVCLVDNQAFTAALIAYSSGEIDAITDPRDYRPKMWFSVPRENLVDFYPDALRLAEGEKE
jgi:hypothetical protein